MKVSPHFHEVEFFCKCGCGRYIQNNELIYLLESIREHYARKVIIVSGTRCKKHNNSLIGSSKYSQHLKGRAADIRVEGIGASEVYLFCDRLIGDKGGLGAYPSFTHVDVRNKYSRWSNM